MSTTEDADGPEVRLLETGDRREIHPLDAGYGDPPGGEYPLRVCVQQEGDHHGRVERREPPIFLVGGQDGRQIQLLHDQVPHEMGGMPFRDELRDFGGQKPFLLGVPRAEVLAHTYLSYRSAQPLPRIQKNPELPTVWNTGPAYTPTSAP